MDISLIHTTSEQEYYGMNLLTKESTIVGLYPLDTHYFYEREISKRYPPSTIFQIDYSCHQTLRREDVNVIHLDPLDLLRNNLHFFSLPLSLYMLELFDRSLCC